jgi:hypothetical protein
MSNQARGTRAALATLFPEVAIGVLLFDAARQRVRRHSDDRGDAVQWVILAAVGAAIAITVGTILYGKLRDKANGITTDTPAPGQ